MKTKMPSVEDLTQDPEFSEYTTPGRLIGVLTLVVGLVLGETLFPGMILWFYERATADLIGLFLAHLPEVIFLVGMVVVHECIHYGAGQALGHSPRFGVKWVEFFWVIKEPTPHVVTLNEYISRNENIIALGAPLVIIDAAALLVFLLPLSPAATYYAMIVLVVNTASSMQDFYNVVQLFGMPADTQYINLGKDGLRTFYCKSASERLIDPQTD